MAKYPFLSDDWVAEARNIYAEAEAVAALARGAAPAPVRVNLVVTEVPFGAGALNAHVDTSAGWVAIDTGHLDNPDVTVSLDYVTARSLFVSGDVQAALAAFLSGRIKVDGDLTKLLDPSSGIWPAGAAPLGGAGLFGEARPAGAVVRPVPAPAPTPPAARQSPGGATSAVFDIASRLQEMTEQ